MKLSRSDFLNQYETGQLNIAFIGMSNIGKSYAASRIAQHYNFTLFEIDQIIWKLLGHESMEEFAAWQGQPYEDDYKARERRSIELETQATLQALNEKTTGNRLLDTTGSVIYVNKQTLKTLIQTHYIIYITASDSDMERLHHDYFENQKPLIWADQFTHNPAHSNLDNIKNSYPKLLDSRARQYQALADISLTSRFILDAQTSAKDIFTAITPSV